MTGPTHVLVAFIVAAVLSGHRAAFSADIHVPAQYATIYAAIDAATEGDRVLVAPGTYSTFTTRQILTGGHVSSVGFLKKGVALESSGGAEVTILRMDATVAEPSILFYLGSPGDASVRGFTFTGIVAGLSCVDFSFTGRGVVRDCVFRDFGTGLPDEYGVGGVSADLEVYNCRFENIFALSQSGIAGNSVTAIVEDCRFRNLQGAGIALRPDWPHAMGLIVRRCTFENISQPNGGGGGIYAVEINNVLIEDCLFDEITCTGSGCGVLTGGFDTIVTVRGSLFSNNRHIGAGRAGGMYLIGQSILVERNTFYDNAQQIDWPTGGASATFYGGAVNFRENVVAKSQGESAVALRQGTITTNCNVYWNNPLGNTSGFSPDPTDIEADPLFCSPESNDFTLNSASPCLPGNHPFCSTLIGAYEQGCGTVSIAPQSWGRIKGLYRATTRGESR